MKDAFICRFENSRTCGRFRADVVQTSVQRDILHDRHLSGGLDVPEVLLAQHFGCGLQPRGTGFTIPSR